MRKKMVNLEPITTEYPQLPLVMPIKYNPQLDREIKLGFKVVGK